MNLDKPTAYIEVYKDKIIVSSGDGKFLYFEKKLR